MKHASIRELFAYWHNLRGSRPAPERGDIEPVAIRNPLADVFILSLEPHAGHPFRVAGTRVCALFGREIKGESFLALFSPDARSAMRKLIGVITRESIGVVASVCEFDAAQPPRLRRRRVAQRPLQRRRRARALLAHPPRGPPE